MHRIFTACLFLVITASFMYPIGFQPGLMHEFGVGNVVSGEIGVVDWQYTQQLLESVPKEESRIISFFCPTELKLSEQLFEWFKYEILGFRSNKGVFDDVRAYSCDVVKSWLIPDGEEIKKNDLYSKMFVDVYYSVYNSMTQYADHMVQLPAHITTLYGDHLTEINRNTRTLIKVFNTVMSKSLTADVLLAFSLLLINAIIASVAYFLSVYVEDQHYMSKNSAKNSVSRGQKRKLLLKMIA